MECTPIKNVHSSSTGTLPAMNPPAATSMMAISRFFTKRIMRVLSNLSVNCPEVAENNKNGRMNSAPITSPAIAGGSHDTLSW